MDYVGVVMMVHSSDPDRDLKRIYLELEHQSQIVIDRIKSFRRDYVERRTQDNILLDLPAPANDNELYDFIGLSHQAHSFMKKLMRSFPYLYDGDVKTTAIEILDRSVLMKVSLNEELSNNEIYRQWKLTRLIEKEKMSQNDWDYILEKVSVKKKNVIRRSPDEN
jgi:hypothetical protein